MNASPAERTKTLLLAFLLLLATAGGADQMTDLVVVNKSARELVLMNKGEVLQRYRVALGGNPEGHKRQQGDRRTPEGRYVLDYKKPDSAFHKAIHISYPNAADRAQARKRGVDPGGLIMIHGQKNGFAWLEDITQRTDWTDGCIAVKDSEMDEIWRSVAVGTPIQINP